MRAAVLLALLAGLGPASAAATLANLEPRKQRQRTETAFAKTMAERDHAALTSFLADEAVFLGRTTQRGKAAVAAAGKSDYGGPKAPFSGRPDRVEVPDSGTVGMTSGPVFHESGQRIGTFNSVRRRHQDGCWRIVFDIGCPSGEPTPTPPSAQ